MTQPAPPPRSPDPAPPREPAPPAAAVRISSAQLFGAAAEVQIDHRGVLYRLRQTALGKLILSK